MHETELIDKIITKNVSNELSTDINVLPVLIRVLDKIEKKYSLDLLNFIHSLLLNPFDIKLILSHKEIKELIDFNICCLNDPILIKKASQNLSIIMNNLFITSKEDRGDKILSNSEENLTNICENMTFEKFMIMLSKLNKITYFRIIKEFSKLNKIPIEMQLNNSDPIIILRYKIKILTFQALKGFISLDKHINSIKEYLNHENAKLGWTVSKSLFKMIKILSDQNDILIDLTKEMDLFNSSYWINVTNLLSLFILENKCINYEFYKKMLVYWKEDTKSNLVRESALFYVYTHVKMNLPIEMNDIILVAIFDHHIQCRKAATSILFEYFIKNNTKFYESILLIVQSNPFYKKDIPSLIQLSQNNTSLNIKDHLILLLSHFNVKIRKMATKFLQNFIICTNEITNKKSPFVILGILSFLNNKHCCNSECNNNFNKPNFNTFTFIDNNDHCYSCADFIINNTICKEEHFCEYELNFLNDLIFDDCLFNTKLFINLVEEYIFLMIKFILHEGINIDIHIKNIIYIIEKDSLTDWGIFLCKKILNINNNDFSELIYNGLMKKRKKSFILANIFNINFRNEIINFLFKRINEHSLKGILYLIMYSDIIINDVSEIKNGLENYETDFTGDKGVFIRLFSLRIINYFDKVLFSKYFIRYFVDKSKLIRDHLVITCYKGKNNLFSFINQDIFYYDTSLVNDFLNEYYYNYNIKYKESNYGHDLLHYECSFISFNKLNKELKNEFIYGALIALRNSDSLIYNFIINELLKIKKEIILFIKEILLSGSISKKVNVTLYFINEVIKKDLYFKNELSNFINEISNEKVKEKIKEIINE